MKGDLVKDGDGDMFNYLSKKIHLQFYMLMYKLYNSVSHIRGHIDNT